MLGKDHFQRSHEGATQPNNSRVSKDSFFENQLGKFSENLHLESPISTVQRVSPSLEM